MIWYTIIMSIVGFVLFAWDKHSAQHRNWRISERTLLLCSLLGGWPGATLAIYGLRHKTRKQPFATYFKLCIFTHAVFMLYHYLYLR